MEKITRREFHKKIVAGVAGIAATSSGILPLYGMTQNFPDGKKPNFVFITSDQHNAKYAGYAGHPFIKTPNLDKIAKKGVVFANNYTGNPVCVPGRSCMMTGMYASDVNSFCNSTVYDGSYSTWGKRLKDAGYYCWATGKQDLNPKFDMGFVESNVDHGHAKNPDITSLFRRPCIFRVGEREELDGKLRTKRNNDVEDKDNGLNFIKNESTQLNKPWVCYVGFHMPHPAFVGLKEYYDYYLPKVEIPNVTIDELEKLPLPYQELRNFKRISTPLPEERIKRIIAAYFSMITELDEYIGDLYKALEDSGQIENTYFIYTSDHGESLGEHGLWHKNNLFDVASRVPLVMTGPHLPQGKVITEPISHVDLVASMIELAGIKNAQQLRGTSLLSLIKGHKSKAPEFVYSESHSEGNPTGSCMIRKGDWKLIHFSYYGDALFNMKEDPDEKNNLIDDPSYKEVANGLMKLLYSKVDPEEITERAFKLQEDMLQKFVNETSEEGLFKMFKGRLGEGQSRVIIGKLKGRK